MDEYSSERQQLTKGNNYGHYLADNFSAGGGGQLFKYNLHGRLEFEPTDGKRKFGIYDLVLQP